MSKKSRKRNRRLLMMAALAGGAALAGRGKGTAFPRPKEGTIDQMAADATDSAVTDVVNPNLNKSVVSDGPVLNVTGGIHAGKPAKGMFIKARNKNRVTGVDGPPSILNPYDPRTHTMRGMNRAKGGRIGAKKGGSVKKARVTGIAKRGFGRALMKGRK